MPMEGTRPAWVLGRDAEGEHAPGFPPPFSLNKEEPIWA